MLPDLTHRQHIPHQVEVSALGRGACGIFSQDKEILPTVHHSSLQL